MYRSILSYFSAIALSLVSIFFLTVLSLSFYGINNASGDFLKESFTFVSFYIPFYIIIAAILSFKKRFHYRWVILLTSTILPFFTLVLFFKVFLAIDTSLPVLFVVDTIGRKEGTFLLLILFLIEIVFIYSLSIKTVIANRSSINNDKNEQDISTDSIIVEPRQSEPDYSTPAILRAARHSDSHNTINNIEQPENLIAETSVDLPKLQELNDLKSIPSKYSEDELTCLYDDTKQTEEAEAVEYTKLEDVYVYSDFSDPKVVDEELMLNDDNRKQDELTCLDNDDKQNIDTQDEYITYNEVNPVTEVFSNIEKKDLINEDISPNSLLDDKIKNLPVLPIHNSTYENYNIPIKNILNNYSDGQYWVIDDQTRIAAKILKETLEEFKIKADVTGIQKGPVITMFEILPAPGVKLSKITNLVDNIAMRLAASRVRIVAPIPGKHAVGIEIPNKERAIVSFREMLNDDKFQDSKNEIPVTIGKDITGNTQIIDLVKTPHLLIAGATGSGKSVCVNALICSILYRRTPDQVRLLLIDPKIVELKLYNDIPHLLTPVITEPKRAFQALQYCVYIMEQRYLLLDSMGVRDIRSYNKKIIQNRIATKKLPYIVVIVDEFADLMATSGKELESILARLAAMARAVGIHLVLATQRPSIDVITGLIKANIPSRIAFMVSNKIDSRIILDTAGADKLLGQGDMLFSSAWDPSLTRIQGAFVSDTEVESVTAYVKTLGVPDYIDDEIFYDDEDDTETANTYTDNYDTNDSLMDEALEIVVSAGKASASYLQRRLQIGYNRAARIVEEMERRGIVGPPNGSKPRDILYVPDKIKN